VNAPAFELPRALEAREPPEARGLARDEVRMMIGARGSGEIVHAHVRDLPTFLDAGDLLVINTSATLPAALPARRDDGTAVELRLSTPAPHHPADAWWLVEVRSADGASPRRDVRAGEVLSLPAGGAAEILVPFAAGPRLWLARLNLGGPTLPYLHRHGHPIRYGYVPGSWALADYQTAFALEPGSAEMPSAGRPLTAELITHLVASGVLVAPVTLHTGVSSPERGEAPYPERYRVPAQTARIVNAVRAWGGRVVAVGTTVVRALETVADEAGVVHADEGWTNLVVSDERGVRAVDGLLTGWHEPEASHLQMLQAIAGDDLLERCYTTALEHGYLWHEFGDVHLIVP
jgi:S-adenosylmethionine:tRNA ribosyltransferase-isomerase